MSKVTNPLEVIDYCPVCGAELLFGQLVLKHGVDLLCSTACFIKHIGAVVITAGDHERGDASQHENDPTD
ncbi:hypothetical protein PaeBR_18840 [Paenibacillus sp. BR2-3]|uniref:hypothetical protein n=1 Tax=Paenibacillus sp. BR2-3 TaxID=3048494 RepID=UPI00397796E6